MEKGEMRADLSLSVRKIGVKTLGTRVEIKNLNSINGAQKAAKHEFARQVDAILAGKKILQETRGFDPKSQTTFAMRLKEDANEYLYIPDYNLPPLELTDEYIQHQKHLLPKLPKEICTELIGKGLSWSNAYLIAYEQEYLAYFTQVTADMTNAQTNTAAKLMIGDLFGLLKETTRDLQSFNPKHLQELTIALDKSEISSKIAKELLLLAFEQDISPKSQIVEQVSDVNAIATCVDQVLLKYPDEIARYKSGKTNLLGFFVGNVMKEMRNANPNVVGTIVQDKLKD
jgi:aspartyl-tRNA(Asn)/glutamyl-tRNA(Gln) amidotransferase subunit B